MNRSMLKIPIHIIAKHMVQQTVHRNTNVFLVTQKERTL